MLKAPIFPQPKIETTHDFIVQSCGIERLTLSYGDVAATHARRAMSPLAAGHFGAFNYIFNTLLKSSQFPCDHPIQFESEHKSDVNLYWLREIHKKLMMPLSTDVSIPDSLISPLNKKLGPQSQTVSLNEVSDVFDSRECGKYRLANKVVGLNRRKPKPTSLVTLMHLWYKSLGEFHLGIRYALGRPSIDTLDKCAQKAREAHMELQAIDPFLDGSGRTARVVENLLRLRWGLPWRTDKRDDAIQYANEIMAFENSPKWKSRLDECNAKP